MTLEEQRDIIQAAIDGKDVVWTTMPDDTWHKFWDKEFNFTGRIFKVVPREPRRHWCNEHDGQISSVTWDTRDDAKCNSAFPDSNQIEFVEVIK